MEMVLSDLEKELLGTGLMDLIVNSTSFNNIEKEIYEDLYHRIKKL
ncbi:hypothetical protein [Brevibacillus porteri]